MKTIAKILLILVILLCGKESFAQQIEIVVVGSSHENNPGDEDYEKVVNKLKRFNPDMVFGEYLSPTDYHALEASNWAYEGLKKGQNIIFRAHPEELKNIDKKITRANKSLDKFAYYHKLRMDLASYYVMQADRANAEYQFFIIENYMKKAFGAEEKAYYEKSFGSLDSIKKAGLYRSKSEYTNIYFPLLYALKQNKLYAMDCQKYDEPWSKAWALADSSIKELEKKANADTASEEAKTYAAIEKYSTLTAEDKKMATSSAYYNMAHQRYAELNDAWNFYGGSHFYGYTGFPDQHIKDMYAQWALRNEGMCANIMKQAKEKKAKRVIVGVGAAHRKSMEEILSRDPQVKVISYLQLP